MIVPGVDNNNDDATADAAVVYDLFEIMLL